MRDHTEVYFSISDLRIGMFSDRILQENKNFSPCKETGKEADITVLFTGVDQLSLNGLGEKDKVFQSDGFYVIHTDKGFVRCYHEHQQPEAVYALRYRESNRRIVIEYLREKEKYFSEYQNSFYHVALEDLLLPFDRLILHASYVRSAVGGILFSGASGIGKSTQAKLWCQHRKAVLINGDRPVIGRSETGKWCAYGSPYAGSSRCYRRESDPIRAVVFLQQSPENQVRKLTPKEAFRWLYANVTVNSWNPEFVLKICRLLEAFIKEIPVYELRCTPDVWAVQVLEEKLKGDCNGRSDETGGKSTDHSIVSESKPETDSIKWNL